MLMIWIVWAMLKLNCVYGHAVCLDGKDPFPITIPYCGEFSNSVHGVCCDIQRDQQIREIVESYPWDLIPDDECRHLVKEIECVRCDPYESHLLETGKVALCRNFCKLFEGRCGRYLKDLGYPENYCQVHSNEKEDPFYCYPFDEDKFFEGKSNDLVEAFKTAKIPKEAIQIQLVPGTNIWWAILRPGQIYEFENDPINARPAKLVFDLSWLPAKLRKDKDGNGRVYGIAFAPDFISSKVFYVHYFSYDPAAKFGAVSRLRYFYRDPQRTFASEQLILQYRWFDSTVHHSSNIFFRKDGYLYIPIGDGSQNNDPTNEAQNKFSLAGKILRIDVSDVNSEGYDIPPDNPFASDRRKGAPEVWVWGVRHFWKCTLDRKTDDIWCGEVGHQNVEEINLINKPGNAGWKVIRGNFCSSNQQSCNEILSSPNYIAPVFAYCHNGFEAQCKDKSMIGNSVIGGYRYRGSKHPELYGRYIFGDYTNAIVSSLRFNSLTKKWENIKLYEAIKDVAFFAEDNQGELYIGTYPNSKLYFLKGKIQDTVQPSVIPTTLPTIAPTQFPTRFPTQNPTSAFPSDSPISVKLKIKKAQGRIVQFEFTFQNQNFQRSISSISGVLSTFCNNPLLIKSKPRGQISSNLLPRRSSKSLFISISSQSNTSFLLPPNGIFILRISISAPASTSCQTALTKSSIQYSYKYK